MRLNKYLLNEERKNIPALLSYGIATLTPSSVNNLLLGIYLHEIIYSIFYIIEFNLYNNIGLFRKCLNIPLF